MSRALSQKPAVHRHFHRIAWFAIALTLCVIVFGAFVRLSNAGLSCPDWPTCYGQAAWPTEVEEAAGHVATAIRPVEPEKAWREQFHRMIAGGLGVLTLILALLSARRRRFGIPLILAASALIASGVVLYMRGQPDIAGAPVVIGELALLIAALRWNNEDLARASTFTLALIVFQAVLGMWTVTWLLKPAVVMGHLLGGMATLSMLTWIAWRATERPVFAAGAATLRRLLVIAIVLIGLQIALGGWVSANYAALACGNDFPTCVGQWAPRADFHDAFVLWRGVGPDYEGGVLGGEARIAIQLAHRAMAVLVFVYVGGLAIKLIRTTGLRAYGLLIATLIIAQVGLGIANVVMQLPLWTAVMHNGGAALLLFVIVGLLARLRSPV